MNHRLIERCKQACRDWHDDQLPDTQMMRFGNNGLAAVTAPHVLFTELLDALKDVYHAVETEEDGWYEPGELQEDVNALEAVVAVLWPTVAA